ncbi:MAG: hypothetical protein IOB85_06425 [Methylobacterium sp.]|nr:hypothetical protein [Methylobacterium sp.]MCA3662428.1 hypothetical protein [Methylobacterium sp.]MCA3672541.1 hypothetical protein [Methylobacterium sp.]MCA3678739.1 hypothetical protein [Methylobacterium sp.]MCA3680571.1 hypothetical protein [Methylobacterium sp.]
MKMTKPITQPKNIKDIFMFLEQLRLTNIHFSLRSSTDDSISVDFTLVGCRVEVDFFDDHIEFSYFTGSESVHDDWKLMQDLLDKHWSDD